MAVLDDDVFFNPGDFSRRVTVADLKETIGEGSGGEVTWANVTGKPSTYAPTIGTTATTAKAGNYAPSWNDVTGKPAVIASGADAAAARTAIGAGTSNLAIGTTATTAKAGNYTPPNASASVKGLVSMGAAVADATEETQLAQLNALLASLRAAGIIAA